MGTSIPTDTLQKFTTFGDMLRFLRRRAGITQMELAIAVGYSDAQISRLEQNLRLPDIPTIEARFAQALYLDDEPKAVARLLELAANVRREDVPALGLCPYKGLNYFDESDAELFVGREALAEQLTEQVLKLATPKRTSGARFLAIVGASGSGKSSLVRAGLIPSLRWGKQTAGWQIISLTPSARPLESLAGELTQGSSVAATARLIDDLRSEPRSLHLFAKQLTKAEGAPHLLLVVDQFEELFTLCHSEVERACFIDNLLTAASEPAGPTIVILTLRADFYAACAAYPLLRQGLADHQEYIGAMNEQELRRVIEEPARRGRWELEPGLTDLVLYDVGQEPGALPLLSHALMETWGRRRGHTMTLSGYTSSGGVRGAIAETAEAVFTDQFTQEQQAIARRMFLRLTELGEEDGTVDTRRRVAFEELGLHTQDASAVQAVLQSLANARLITLSADAADVAHEALIREWPRLRGWLQENREGLRLHRQLSDAAQDWARLDREQGALYRGARLTQGREWAAANADEMNALEREFLAASVEAAEREAGEGERRRQSELEAAQNLAKSEQARAEALALSANRLRLRNRIISMIGSTGLILAILAGLFGAQARSNLRVAQANLARAESLRLGAEANVLLAQNKDPETAVLLSIRALQSAYSPQADDALSAALYYLYNREIFTGHTGEIYSVAFSPDGKFVLTGSQDGTARLWQVHGGHSVRQFAGHQGGVSAVAFSPDGKSILTGGNDKTVRLWDAATGRQLRMFAGHAGGISSVAFSPDGRYVLSASGDKTAQLWDARTGQAIRTFIGHQDFVSSVAFSPNGHYVLTASFDKTARLWDAASGDPIRTFTENTELGRLTGAALSSDGKYIITGSDDHTARLWDAETGQEICIFTGHTDSVNAVAFSPDAKQVLTGSKDTTARIWDASTCREIRVLVGHQGTVKSIAFSPDGQFVLTGSQDRVARLWAAPSSAPMRTLTLPAGKFKSFTYSPEGKYVLSSGGVNAVAFSPDGKFLLTGGDDHIARAWDAATGKELRDFIGHTNGINSVAFSPDGRYVLTGSSDQTARLWNAETGQEIRIMPANVSAVVSVAFSPDGKYFLTTGISDIGTGPQAVVGSPTKLWEVATGKQARAFNFGPYFFVYGGMSSIVAFSPDGKRAAVMDSTIHATLFDIGTGYQICGVSHTTYVTSVAFSPDGQYILTGSDDKTARLWDASNCGQLRVFTDQASLVTSVAFSPDGKHILTGHDDNKARLWDAATGALLREFTGHTSWVTSVAFSPDGRYVLTGSEDGTARLWDTDYRNTIRFACSLLGRDLTSSERARFNIADDNATCGR